MNSYNILVTGCGGDIGQSIGKILTKTQWVKSVFGCDLHREHAGLFIFDECFVVSRAQSPAYWNEIINLVNKKEIDLIIPSTEAELSVFLNSPPELLKVCCLIMPNSNAVELGLDKYKTIQFLETHGLPFPRTEKLEDVHNPEFPCVVKSSHGSGGKGFYIVRDNATWKYVSDTLKDAICQQYIDAPDEEYTCGLFRSKNGTIRHLIFRRKLMGGFSGFGMVIENVQIRELLIEIANKLDLIGSINVQLRLIENVPLVFEINARFSSTVLFRHLLGFHDLIWSIQDATGQTLESYTPPPAGSTFYKGFNEYVVFAK
jgi:carbamoyl-phosphate synthase large subunit